MLLIKHIKFYLNKYKAFKENYVMYILMLMKLSVGFIIKINKKLTESIDQLNYYHLKFYFGQFMLFL